MPNPSPVQPVAPATPSTQLAALRDLADALAQAQTAEEVHRALALQARALVGADRVALAVPSPLGRDVEVTDAALEPGCAAHAADEGGTDLRAAYLWGHRILRRAEPSGRCTRLSAPLRAGERVVGSASLTWQGARELPEDDLVLVDTLLALCAAAAERVTDGAREARAREAREETARRKDHSLALLGHELRNPLATLRTAVEVLTDPRAPAQGTEQAREIIVRQLGHMGRMLDDLLDVSRLSAGKLEVLEDPVDLARIAHEAVTDHAAEIAAAELSVALRAPAPVPVTGDGTRLAQVLRNLLHNAVKFGRRGGRVTVSVRAADGEAHVIVEDDGVGIAPDLLPRLFEPFVQGDQAAGGAGGGLGLGLALVAGLVRLHHGRMEVTSDGVGRGARFLVALPLRASAVEGYVADPSPSRMRRVLVVEDNADAATMLRMVLELGGHEVAVAGDGREALAVAPGFGPEVVLCDIGLPDMDGYAVGRGLRAALGATPLLVALTGFGQAEDQRRALEAGFDRHLTKPVDPFILEQLVAGEAT